MFPKISHRWRHDRKHPEREPAVEAEAGRVQRGLEGHGRQVDGLQQAVQEGAVAVQPLEATAATATASTPTTATTTTASNAAAAASTTTAATTPSHAFPTTAAAATNSILPRY